MFMSDLPPWPRYRPIRIIGQGGFGTVYLCEDTEPTSVRYAQLVAVKAISLTALSDEEALMVMSEVALLKNVDHPNIIQYYDSFLYEEEDEGEGEDSDAAVPSNALSLHHKKLSSHHHHRHSNDSDNSSISSSVGGEVQGRRRRRRAATPCIVGQWLCLVTEYMDGGDLSSFLKQYTQPAPKQSESVSRHDKDEEPNSKGEFLTLLAAGELQRLSADGKSPSPRLLGGPYCAELLQWDSASDGDAAEVSSQQLFNDHRPPLPWQPFNAAAFTSEMPLTGQPHRPYRPAESTSKYTKATKARGEGNCEPIYGVKEGDDWERQSSQHRRRLASTLRLAAHPFAPTLGASSTGSSKMTTFASAPAPTQTHTRLLLTADASTKMADRAALDTWISDTAQAIMPATPLAATELDAFRPFDTADSSHSPLNKATMTKGMASSTSSLLLSSQQQLEAQLPPDPNQLWVESFLITDIAKQCLDALAYLHALGIIHRDIKPSNIYLSKKDGTVKIGDFGVSKLLQPSAPFATTFVGTPFYLCPELCMGDPYSFGADVWALGVLLYELYCLKLPFAADNVLGQIYVITEGTYDKRALRCPHAFADTQRAVLEDLYGPSFAQSEVLLHGLVVELVEQMLSVDPAQRPSAETLLTRVFGGGGAFSRVGSSAGTSAAPSPMHRPPSAELPPLHKGEEKPSCSNVESSNGVAIDRATTAEKNRHDGRGGEGNSRHQPSRSDSNWTGGEMARGNTAAGRLGPMAADEHARWASSLVQAASAARSGGNSISSSSSPAYEGNSTVFAPPASIPNNNNAFQSQAEAEAAKEPLAIKVKLNMLDILQEMPYEQRERLETQAARDDAYNAQRLTNAVLLSPSGMAADASAADTANSVSSNTEQRQLSASHSFGDYTQLQLLPPVFLPTNQLYGSDSAAGKLSAQVSMASLLDVDSVLKAQGGTASSAALLSASMSEKGEKKVRAAAVEEDSLDRLIGADTRDELSSLFDEVPWLQNAAVFSAIPLSVGSDDVMLVSRAGVPQSPPSQQQQQQQQRSNSHSGASGLATGESRKTASESGNGRRGDGGNRSSMYDASGGATQRVDGEGKCLPAPAIRYAGSVSRNNPGIEVADMPQRNGSQRRRTSIVGVRCRASDDENAQQSQHEPQPSWHRRPLSGSQAVAVEEQQQQRRVSRSSTTATVKSGGRKATTTPRRQRVSVTAVAATAAIVAAPPLTASSMDSPGDNASTSHAGNHSHRHTVDGDEKSNGATGRHSLGHADGAGANEARAAEQQKEAEEAPATAAGASSHGGSGVPHCRLPYTEPLREGSAAEARIRPVSSANESACTALGAAASADVASNANSGNSRGSGGAAAAADAHMRPAAEAHASAKVEDGFSVAALNKRERLEDFPVTPLASAGVFPPPTPVKVQAAGRCEGFSTSELESLLRARLLAHYQKRQQALRARRAEAAAQEPARVKMRGRMAALFTAVYNARTTSASPDSVKETASYHSMLTNDTTTLSNDEDTGAERLLALARVPTLPPVPETSHTSATRLPTPSLPSAEVLPAVPFPPPSVPQLFGVARSPSPVTPVTHCSPDAASLDRTARQAVREGEVLRTLSARHATEKAATSTWETKVVHPVNAAQNSSRVAAETTHAHDLPCTQPTTESTSPVNVAITTNSNNTNISNNSNNDSVGMTVEKVEEEEESDNAAEYAYLMATPAVRRLRQAAVLAAAVERQKAVFRTGDASPARIVVAPPWRPPHDSKDVPGLWETSSAEEEAEADARGRPGRPAPVRVREELRWRWSAPPSEAADTTDDEEEDDSDSNEEEEEVTVASSEPSRSPSSVIGPLRPGGGNARERNRRLVTSQGTKTPQQFSGEETKHDSAGAARPSRMRKTTSKRDEMKKKDLNPEQGTKGSTAVRHHAEDADGEELQRQSSLLGSPIELRASHRCSGDDFPSELKDMNTAHSTHSSSSDHSSRHRSNTSSEGNPDSHSSSSSSSNTSSDENEDDDDNDDEDEEDMSYTYTVQIDADTGYRYFDYVCPLTLELVGELPATCRVITRAQWAAETLQLLSPSETRPTSIFPSAGLVNFMLTSPSPPPHGGAAVAPSPTGQEREKEGKAKAQKAVAKGGKQVRQSRMTPPLVSPVLATPTAAQRAAETSHPGSPGSDKSKTELNSLARSSCELSLFQDCSLLLPPHSPTPSPPHVAQTEGERQKKKRENGKPVDAAKRRTPGNASDPPAPSAFTPAMSSPPTTLQRSSSYAGDATRVTATATANDTSSTAPKANDNEGFDNLLLQRRVESMFIVGTKLMDSTGPVRTTLSPKEPLVPDPTKTPRPAGEEEEKRENKVSRKPNRTASSAKRRGRSGLSGTLNHPSTLNRAWRVRVPPPQPPTPQPSSSHSCSSSAAAAAVTDGAVLGFPAAAESRQYIFLPVSFALRPIRARTRFVGLLWRLWFATQYADPALQRVILGAERCRGSPADHSRTFAAAFGDWMSSGGNTSNGGSGLSGDDSTTAASSLTTLTTTTTTTTTTAASTANAEASTSASGSIPTDTSLSKLSSTHNNSNNSNEFEPPVLRPHTTVDKAREGEAGVATDSDASSSLPPRSRWSLYYVEPHLNVALRLQSDAEWTVVRHKVAEMGHLLPFIRLYLVLHEAESMPVE